MSMKMNKWISGLIIMGVALISESAVAVKYQKLDQYLDLLAKNDKIMASLTLREKGKVVFQKHIGLADVEKGEGLSEQSKFRVGSISKIFTSVVILKLYEMDKLNLSDKLAKYYPEIPNAEKITISHLLSHRSGIFNFTDDRTYPGYMTKPQSQHDLLQIIRSFPSQFEPDSQYSYSNSNYVLLGYIAEKVTKQPLKNLVSEYITKPLALNNTYLGTDEPRATGEAFSYRYEGKWSKFPDTALSIPSGAGAVISTSTDITAFLEGLFSGQLLSKDSMTMMKAINEGYGYGLMSFPFYEHKALGHGGGIDGFVSSAGYFEEQGLAMTVLANGVNFAFNDVLIATLSAYFGKEFDMPDFSIKAVSLSSEQLEAYVGNFETEHLPMDIKVFVENEQLMAQATGQGAFPLTPFENHEFRFEPAGIVMQFDIDKKQFTLLQGGGKYKFVAK